MKRFIPSRKLYLFALFPILDNIHIYNPMKRAINLTAAFLLSLFTTFFALQKMNYPLIGIDDANIYFVYARNLSNGYGFVYNVGGEKVEGFTSLLWTLISALAFKLTASPELTLLIINITLVGLGIAYALVYLQHSCSKDGYSGRDGLFWSALFLLIIFSTPGYIIWNTISLMENALWSTLLLLMCIFVIRDHPSTKFINSGFLLLSILLLLTRPESFLWVAVFLAILFLRLAFTGGILYALKALAPSITGILIVLILLTLFRLQYFGYPLPNTFYAKVSPSIAYNLWQGLEYLVRYMVSDPIAFIDVLVVILACYYSILKISPGSGEFYLPFIAAIGLLIPFLIGGDHFGSFRFYQNVYPIMILCLFYFIRIQIPQFNGSRPAMKKLSSALVVLLLTGFGISQYRAWSRFPSEMKSDYDIAHYERLNGAFIQNLFSSLPRLPSVGVIAAGGFKYSYSGEVVDLVGLNNSIMAHNHGDRMGYHGHSAFEIETFYQLQADAISPMTVNELWHYREEELKNSWDNQLAFKGLFDQPRFLAYYQYAKICKALPAGCELAVVGWFRKDFLESLVPSGEFTTVRYPYTPKLND